MRRSWWVFLVGAIAALTLGTAAKANGAPNLTYVDVPLYTEADGSRKSAVFSVNSRTRQRGQDDVAVPVRMYVRDRDIPTKRGPHDRVCIRGVADTFLPLLAISPMGSKPGTETIIGNAQPDRAKIVCSLLPAANSYRVWSESSAPLQPSEQWRWTTPDAFRSVPEWRDQGDIAVPEKILNSMATSLRLDGMCVEIFLLRAEFSAPDEIIGQPRWMLQQYSLASSINGFLNASMEWTYKEMDMSGGNLHFRSLAGPDLNTDGSVHPYRMGFGTVEEIQKLFANTKLTKEQGWPMQWAIAGCFGDKVDVYTRNRQNPEKTSYFGYLSLAIVLPYWLEYENASPAAKAFWQAFHNELAMHELVHVHDQLKIMNEIVFQSRGMAMIQQDFSRTSGWPGDAKELGLSLDRFMQPLPAEALLEPANTAQRRAGNYASESFHAAVLLPATPIQPASHLDIWLRPGTATTFGDRNVLLEERRKILEMAGRE